MPQGWNWNSASWSDQVMQLTPSQNGPFQIVLFRSLVKAKRPRHVLLLECVARTLKNLMRRWFRETVKDVSNSEFKLKTNALNFLNLVSGSSPRAQVFWAEQVTRHVLQKFGNISLSKYERENLFKACCASSVLPQEVQIRLVAQRS